MTDRPTRSLVDDACTLFVVGLASWSLVFQAVVAARGTLHTLTQSSPVAAILAVGLFLLLRRRAAHTPAAAHPAEPAWRRGWVPLLLAMVPPTAFVLTGKFLHFWAPACVLLAAGWAINLRPSAPLRPVTVCESRGALAGLLGLGLATVAAFLLVHRANGDDPFYLNLVTGTLDFPDEPLLRFDHMHGVPGTRLLMPVYMVHAYDLLPAVVTRLTGLWHVAVKNLYLPALSAPFTVAAAAFLLQRLVPRRWPVATAAVIALMVVMTAFSAGFGNHSFGRFQHGKPVFVSIVMPIIVAYALRFAAEGGWRNGALLLLSQVAGVGATSTALWAGPIALGLALGSAWVPTRTATVRLLAGLATSAYCIVTALVVARSMSEVIPTMSDSASSVPPIELETALQFGIGPAAWLFLWSVAGAWAIPADAAHRRVLAGTALGMLVIFYNPFLMVFWSLHVTGIPTFGRVWWALPRHIWLGMMVLAPLTLGLRRPSWLPPAMQGGLAAAMLGVFALLAVPGRGYPEIEFNEISYRWPPEPKVPLDRRAILHRIGERLPPRSVILAPYRLAPWLVIDRGHHYPVALSVNYLSQIATAFGPEETEQRRRLLAYMDGQAPEPELLARWLAAGRIQAVVTDRANPHLDSIRAVAAGQGMAESSVDRYVVFQR